ncbi:MAG: hypothetical protein Q7V00_07600 [Sulfurimicrobium sp.]|nr:hypothetical protein [Sulfurimicrobium sp.]MDP2197805.1 hypothetical protein [Sulfurimicrobium sp.]
MLKKAKRLQQIDGSAARNIVATTRELIEVDKAQNRFPVTTLYSNWSLHNQISGSLTALRCLEGITTKLLDIHSQGGNDDGFLQFLSEQVFQVDTLRRELIELSRQHDLSNYLFASDHNWAVFIALVLEGLIGKFLQYPTGSDLPSDPSDPDLLRKSKRLYQGLYVVTNGKRRQIFKAAWITLAIDPWDDRPEHERVAVFHCNMQAFEGPTFVIRITNISPLPEADEYLLIS